MPGWSVATTGNARRDTSMMWARDGLERAPVGHDLGGQGRHDIGQVDHPLSDEESQLLVGVREPAHLEVIRALVGSGAVTGCVLRGHRVEALPASRERRIGHLADELERGARRGLPGVHTQLDDHEDGACDLADGADEAQERFQVGQCVPQVHGAPPVPCAQAGSPGPCRSASVDGATGPERPSRSADASAIAARAPSIGHGTPRSSPSLPT